MAVNEARALTAGFEFDRRYMLIDESHHFITQREIPELALFTTKIDGQLLTIQYKDVQFQLPLFSNSGKLYRTSVWGDPATTLEVSREANDWFSDLLNKKLHLVQLADDRSRQHVNKENQITLDVSLADGYPYLLLGMGSLSALNEKLSTSIAIDRFRPNIVVDTIRAHEEDSWKEIHVGAASFFNMKPCGRCMMITIDQQKATIDNEPLKILNGYRKSGNNVLFGTNLMCTTEGIVRLGDGVSVG